MLINILVKFAFQPETHFFLGNMLAAKGNLSGAIHHYQEALWQQPDHKNVFNTLRVVKCYQKFHRAAQSAAPKDTKPSTPSCQKGAAPAVPTNQETESRVGCKKVSEATL